VNEVQTANSELPLLPEVEASEPSPPRTGPNWLRLAYSFEFLFALLTGLMLWSEIGGQGHLDMMPWYLKLAALLALAGSSVRLTASVVESQAAWNPRSVAWLTGLILVMALMGGITYYYHLHESLDEQNSDDTSTTSVTVVAPGGVADSM
jgi:hypothetical protein